MPQTQPSSASIILGLDFGTTSIRGTYVRDGIVEPFVDAQGNRDIPADVYVSDDGPILAGVVAATQRESGTPTIHPKKLLMEALGTSISTPDGPPQPSAIELAAATIRSFKKALESRVQTAVDHCVLTVPIGSTDDYRAALSSSARLAGFNVRDVLDEPQAAAIAIGPELSTTRPWAVFQLGAGVFSFTVLSSGASNGSDVHDDPYEVRASVTDFDINGDAFDQIVASAIAQSFSKKSGIELQPHTKPWQRLVTACEQAKRKLETHPQVPIDLDKIAENEQGIVDLKAVVTIELLHSLCLKLTRRIVELTEQTLASATLTAADLHEVVVIGDAAQLPSVRSALDRLFGDKAKYRKDANMIIATGAALRGKQLVREKAAGGLSRVSTNVIEKLARTIGLVLPQGRFEPIFWADTELPARQRRVLQIKSTADRRPSLIIGQKDTHVSTETHRMTEIVLDGLSSAPEHIADFELRPNGLLSLRLNRADAPSSDAAIEMKAKLWGSMSGLVADAATKS